MRYSNAWQVIAMTIIWAAVLIIFSNMLKEPQERVQMEFDKPQISMFVQHVGCNEQHKKVVESLKGVSWLGEPQVTFGKELVKGHQGHGPSPAELCAVRIEAEVRDLGQADFVALVATLRDIGIAPAALEFGGLPNFSLAAKVADLSCDSCSGAAVLALAPSPVSAAYYFSTAKGAEVDTTAFKTLRWLASRHIDKATNTVTAVVRENQNARVWEMLQSLEAVGLPPHTLGIVVGQAAGQSSG